MGEREGERKRKKEGGERAIFLWMIIILCA